MDFKLGLPWNIRAEGPSCVCCRLEPGVPPCKEGAQLGEGGWAHTTRAHTTPSLD